MLPNFLALLARNDLPAYGFEGEETAYKTGEICFKLQWLGVRLN